MGLKYYIVICYLLSQIVELKDSKNQSINQNIKAGVNMNIASNQTAKQSQFFRQQKWQSLFKYITFEQTLSAFPFLRQNINPFKIANKFLPSRCGVRLLSFLILNNRIYVNGQRRDPKRRNILMNLMKDILNNTILPDMYFIVDIDDEMHGNLIRKNQHKLCRELPLFTFNKNGSSYFEQTKFLFPDTHVLQNQFQAFQDIKKCNLQYPEEEKKDPRAFFRGLGSSAYYSHRIAINNETNFKRYYHRAAFVELSNQRPDLIDARLNNNTFRPILRTLLQELQLRVGAQNVIGKTVPQNTYCKYRYLLVADGYGASWRRLPVILGSNSLMIKPRSEKIQWFYDKMTPGIHFVQVKDDLSDLIQTIEKLNKDKDQRIRMIKNANQLADKYLTFDSIISFIIQQLKKYANIQKFSQILNEEEKIFLEKQINKGQGDIQEILKKIYQTNKLDIDIRLANNLAEKSKNIQQTLPQIKNKSSFSQIKNKLSLPQINNQSPSSQINIKSSSANIQALLQTVVSIEYIAIFIVFILLFLLIYCCKQSTIIQINKQISQQPSLTFQSSFQDQVNEFISS